MDQGREGVYGGCGRIERNESHVFHRRLDRPLPEAVSAKGVWIYDSDGKKYLDASGGAHCVTVGHGRREVVEAIARQASAVAYVHGPRFTTKAVEELAACLALCAPDSINRFYFCSSGCEAIETAMKLARQVHLAAGEPGRYRLVSRWQSYHGATLGALSATGKPSMRSPFSPMLLPVIHIPPPYCLRCFYGLTYPGCGLRCAHALEEVIKLEGPSTISAFLAETVCGVTLAAVVPPREYYPIVADICKRHGVFLILDEVLCGMGRTGKWFALEHYDIQPDMIVLGKGLNSGYLPLSAVGCREEHMEILKKHTGSFVHGHTYSHHPVASAAGLAVLRIIEEENLLQRVNERGRYLAGILEPLKRHPHVGDVRGIGLMWGIELVKDTSTLETFPREEKVTERLFETLFADGILTYPCTGFANGEGDALMLSLPFIISEGELDHVVEAIEHALKSYVN